MSKEASLRPDREPVLDARTAGILLMMRGRAAAGEGCGMSSDGPEPDSIGRAVLAIHEGEFEDSTLSEAIEEITGAPSSLHPDVLTRMVNQAVDYAAELGISPGDEPATQIAV